MKSKFGISANGFLVLLTSILAAAIFLWSHSRVVNTHLSFASKGPAKGLFHGVFPL